MRLNAKVVFFSNKQFFKKNKINYITFKSQERKDIFSVFTKEKTFFIRVFVSHFTI